MAYITSFVYCDNIQPEITPQGVVGHRILNPLQVLSPISLPSNYSFAISFCVNELENDSENTIRVQFLSPSNSIVNDTNEIKFMAPVQQGSQNSLSRMQFNLDFRNLVLYESGTYKTIVFFNGNPIGEFKIPVSEVNKDVRS